MEDFIGNYGLWILLAGVFLAMHWFGGGCGGGQSHGGPREEDPPDRAKKRPAHSGHAGGCH